MTEAGDEQVWDSPVRWVAEHTRRYVESGGARGHRWSGVHTLLLTTRGRRTGRLRRTPLIYGRDGDRYVVVASNGGRRRNPDWYLNLVAAPRADVQVGAERFAVHARTAVGEERGRLWALMSAIFPEYDRYAARAGRQIPVVVLEPTTPAAGDGGDVDRS